MDMYKNNMEAYKEWENTEDPAKTGRKEYEKPTNGKKNGRGHVETEMRGTLASKGVERCKHI